ncbi:MAG: M48 family metallopeptidase [Nitrosopumilus sp.]|nr:M48 family metallopeptidase [Nitrosopumilus sp.]
MMNYVTLGKTKIPYKVIQSKRRTTEILVDKSGVQVLTSKTKNDKTIHDTIQNHSRWIFKKQLQLRDYIPSQITFKHKSKLPHLGKWYFLEIKKSTSNSFEFKNGKFNASLKNPTKSNIKKLYLDWEKQKATSFLKKRIEKHSKSAKLIPSKIIVKQLKTKWGGVSKKRTLTINQKLIRAPGKIIDYVILHELCHLKIPNHGQSFWNLLGGKMPDFDRRKLWLKTNQYLLE